MTDDSRVEELLEQLLESGETPEEVCRICPELLEQSAPAGNADLHADFQYGPRRTQTHRPPRVRPASNSSLFSAPILSRQAMSHDNES